MLAVSTENIDVINNSTRHPEYLRFVILRFTQDDKMDRDDKMVLIG